MLLTILKIYYIFVKPWEKIKTEPLLMDASLLLENDSKLKQHETADILYNAIVNNTTMESNS